MKLLFSLVLICACFSVNAQLPASCDSTNALNQEVLNVVKPYLGKKVDRGECWDLANLALNQVHAKWDGVLNYGKKVDWKKACIQPGDILQFEKVEFSGKIDANSEYTESFYHHTAIVYAVHDDGKVELIHQNTGQFGKKVGVTTLNFADLKKGTIQAYRPTK